MSKTLEIRLREYRYGCLDVSEPKIEFSEIDNILKEHDDDIISDEEFDKAIDTIIMAFAQRQWYNVSVNIEFKNRNVTKEMTIKEIEKILGHKVKIIKEDDES